MSSICDTLPLQADDEESSASQPLIPAPLSEPLVGAALSPQPPPPPPLQAEDQEPSVLRPLRPAFPSIKASLWRYRVSLLSSIPPLPPDSPILDDNMCIFMYEVRRGEHQLLRRNIKAYTRATDL